MLFKSSHCAILQCLTHLLLHSIVLFGRNSSGCPSLDANQTTHFLGAHSYCHSAEALPVPQPLQRSTRGLQCTANGCPGSLQTAPAGEGAPFHCACLSPALPLPPSFPLSYTGCFSALQMTRRSYAGGWFILRKKCTQFFFELGSLRALRAPRTAQRLPAQLQGNKLLKALMGFRPRLFY